MVQWSNRLIGKCHDQLFKMDFRKCTFEKDTLLKKYTLKNILLKKKYFWKILLFTVQWSRVMRTGIGKWWSFAAATIKGGSCPSISWKPMSTSSNILCLSTFKTLPWKIFLRELSCKSCQIHQVGRSVGWLDERDIPRRGAGEDGQGWWVHAASAAG